MAHSYQQLRRQAVDFVARHAALGPVLVLSDVRAAADEVALEACRGALMDVRRLALREFVLELSTPELNRRGLTPIGRVVREALAARVTSQALERGELSYLRPVAGFPGFPRAITATFEELRLNSVDPDRLRRCGDSGPDLALLLEAYTRELGERGFADHAARVEMSRDSLSSAYNTLRKTAAVALDLSPRSSLERELLRAVLDSARARLELKLSSQGGEAASSLESLQLHLFSGDAVPPREEDESVTIVSTSGESLECVEIARSIHAAAAEGVPFDQIAILLRSPERHQPLILEALRRAAIPVWCAFGARRPDVAGRTLLALLHCAEEGLSASRFAEYLSLGQVPDDAAAPALWERMLVDAAVIGGLDRWETRLAGLRA